MSTENEAQQAPSAKPEEPSAKINREELAWARERTRRWLGEISAAIDACKGERLESVPGIDPYDMMCFSGELRMLATGLHRIAGEVEREAGRYDVFALIATNLYPPDWMVRS